jgi:hypothetical protein
MRYATARVVESSGVGKEASLQPVSSWLLPDGGDVVLNGSTYRLCVLGREETTFDPSTLIRGGRKLTEAEAQGYRTALDVLDQLAQQVSLLNERLIDVRDGLTTRGAVALMQSPSVAVEFKELVTPYAFALLKHGSNVIAERGCVIVPPCGRSRFEQQVERLTQQERGGIDWKRWMDHLFDPVPRATQGFYLFEEADWRRFEGTLGVDYGVACENLRELFDKAVVDVGAMGAQDWAQSDRLSQRIMDLQKAPLEAALEAAHPNCRSVVTRVQVNADGSGTLRMQGRHYSTEFAAELSSCASLLRQAHEALPQFATECREVLLDLACWCRDNSCHDSWAESRPVWIAAGNPDNLVDVSLTFEEKVSRIGSKGGLQLLVCAFDSVPEALRAVYATVQEQGRKRQNLNILFLRQLLVGGGASNYTLAGEKLPDPAGHPQYKVMTFTNTTRCAAVLANRPLILSATDWPEQEFDRLADAAKLQVLFHEYGHTYGDYAEFLGDLGGSVEETNAEASAIYQTARLAPDQLDAVLALEAAWAPVRRTLQGPTEAHSHANIVLFGEFAQAGGLQVVEQADRMLIRVFDAQTLVRVAFQIANRMRLWEQGLPKEHHEQLLEPFDPADRGQDDRIMQAALRIRNRLDEAERHRWRQTVLDECRAYFAIDRLLEISAPVRKLTTTMPGFQPLSVVPTDRRFASVLNLDGQPSVRCRS